MLKPGIIEMVVVLVLMVGAGCAGKGETVRLHPGAVSVAPDALPAPAERLTMAIVPFQDQRTNKGRIGKRTHAAGGYTYYVIEQDDPGRVVAQFMADYFTQKGWQAWVVGQRPDDMPRRADMTMTGHVVEFSGNAVSRSGSTEIAVRMLVRLRVKNDALSEDARMVLQGSGTQTVVVFDDRDVERALDRMMQESLDRFITDVKIENGVFQVK